ncbi:MAG: hypothetical protein HQL67_05710 [Magnetococcales bacterium]|nr:hypothetical protein [Magnetococcales bacterium]
MYESVSFQSGTAKPHFSLPLALNGILTLTEYAEQSQLGLLSDLYQKNSTLSDNTLSEDELFHPYFKQ